MNSKVKTIIISAFVLFVICALFMPTSVYAEDAPPDGVVGPGFKDGEPGIWYWIPGEHIWVGDHFIDTGDWVFLFYGQVVEWGWQDFGTIIQ
jgi:hypothetical protein